MVRRTEEEVQEILESALAWHGDPVLPPVGALVLTNHGIDNLEHLYTVTGYSVLPSTEKDGGSKFLHRVSVNLEGVYWESKNQRLLCDVFPLIKANSIAKG
ncbi:hypothetical protein CPT_Maja_059 [Burkholderia phage Maja]|uniref:Uncharacterized protein n=1 Tax=Burkholderia phage Maja TaxID=2767571 RepID=A0A7S6R781_9CAUD|nr:hypothetical protein CPT_Maja_059 [Burkholderia phage Maja]